MYELKRPVSLTAQRKSNTDCFLRYDGLPVFQAGARPANIKKGTDKISFGDIDLVITYSANFSSMYDADSKPYSFIIDTHVYALPEDDKTPIIWQSIVYKSGSKIPGGVRIFSPVIVVEYQKWPGMKHGTLFNFDLYVKKGAIFNGPSIYTLALKEDPDNPKGEIYQIINATVKESSDDPKVKGSVSREILYPEYLVFATDKGLVLRH